MADIGKLDPLLPTSDPVGEHELELDGGVVDVLAAITAAAAAVVVALLLVDADGLAFIRCVNGGVCPPV